MNRLLDALLWPLLPFAAAWVRTQERRVLAQGLPLNKAESQLAHMTGVRDVSRVRVLEVARMPTPLPRWMQRAAERAGLLSPDIVGMTFGHGIALRKDCRGEARLLIHELTHVAQYERLGGIGGFLRPYLRECVYPGYPRGMLEREARDAETMIDGCVNVRA